MIKSIASRYFRLKRHLEGQENVSIRKRFCLAWLKWRLYRTEADKAEMVEIAKEFRVAEGRVGGHRTLIEKRVRRFFWERSKHKRLSPSREAARAFAQGQFERGEGIHSPEQVALRAERSRASRKKQLANGNPAAKDWIITDPEGNVFRIRSLTAWAKKNNMNLRNLHRSVVYNKKAQGHTARHYDEDLDAHIPWECELFPDRE